MAGEYRVHDLRDDGVVVSDDARKNRTVLAEFRDQVVAQLVFHTAGAQLFFRKGASAQLAEGAGKTHRGTTPKALSISRQPSGKASGGMHLIIRPRGKRLWASINADGRFLRRDVSRRHSVARRAECARKMK